MNFFTDGIAERVEPEWVLPYSITITNATAVGGSTALQGLRAEIGENKGFTFLSVGELMRQFQEKAGVQTIEDFARFCSADGVSFDEICDRKTLEVAGQNLSISEGRMVHVFSRHSRHILLTCPLWQRAIRRQRDPKYSLMSIPDVATAIRKRDDDNRARYDKLYPGWDWPKTDYDLVVDTFDHSKEEVVSMILDTHLDWIRKNQHRLRDLSE